ncbi:hypothetical protein SEVIR_1G226901v4 [Setaria viridis]
MEAEDLLEATAAPSWPWSGGRGAPLRHPASTPSSSTAPASSSAPASPAPASPTTDGELAGLQLRGSDLFLDAAHAPAMPPRLRARAVAGRPAPAAARARSPPTPLCFGEREAFFSLTPSLPSFFHPSHSSL